MTQWYKLDSLKLTYAEYWRFSKSLQNFLDIIFLKWIGKRIDFKQARPKLDGLIRCDVSEFGEKASMVKELISDTEMCGFRFQFCYKTQSLGISQVCSATLLSDDGLILAQVNFCRTQLGAITNTILSFNCVSRRKDNGTLCTIDQPKLFDLPPWDERRHMIGAQPKQIIERHRSWIRTASHEIVPTAKEELEDLLVEFENRHLDFYITRGLFVPMKDYEVETLKISLKPYVEKPCAATPESKLHKRPSRTKRSVSQWMSPWN
ncbi:MAG: hypothetical protein WCT04_13325 [Planctomycetota bacterium]